MKPPTTEKIFTQFEMSVVNFRININKGVCLKFIHLLMGIVSFFSLLILPWAEDKIKNPRLKLIHDWLVIICSLYLIGVFLYWVFFLYQKAPPNEGGLKLRSIAGSYAAMIA